MPGIKRLTETDMPIRLALSLHAPEDALRSQIMPVNERYPLAEVLAACEAHYERKRRQIFIEYVMLAGVNDGYAQAVQLAQILDPKIYKLNLIPYNPTDSIYDGSSRNAIDAFKAALEEHGLRATVRLTRGRDIDAACGQLAAKQEIRQQRLDLLEQLARRERLGQEARAVLEQLDLLAGVAGDEEHARARRALQDPGRPARARSSPASACR